MKIRTLVLGLAMSMVLSGCAMNREQSGGLLGGAAGAAAGSAVGGGSGRVIAIVLGALVGSAVGAEIGRHMDEQDRTRTAEAMEYNPTGQAATWRNPDTGVDYSVTPRRTYESTEGPCREFTMDASIGGRMQQVHGTACRQADGSWEIVR
jgi:surface antigen